MTIKNRLFTTATRNIATHTGRLTVERIPGLSGQFLDSHLVLCLDGKVLPGQSKTTLVSQVDCLQKMIVEFEIFEGGVELDL